MTRKSVSILVCAVTVCVSVATAMAVAQGEHSGLDGRAIAQAYIAGMESGDLDKLTTLFLPDGRSSILENASDEGSWEHYRDHHLKPEMEAAINFRFTVVKESEERFGEAILVRQMGSFTVEVNGETREYRVAVSYVIVTDDDGARIAHLHWSSRPDQRAAKQTAINVQPIGASNDIRSHGGKS